MRKIQTKRQQWLDKHSQLRSRGCASVRRESAASGIPYILAPELWSLDWDLSKEGANKNARLFLNFLNNIKQVSAQIIYIDMRKVRHIVANAALIFKAEIDYISTSKKKSFQVIPPVSEKIRQVFTQTGIATMLGNPTLRSRPERDDVIHWHHARGVKADMARLLDFVNDGFLRKYPELDSLVTGIVEAVLNCSEHAYKKHPDNRNLVEDQSQWWAFSQIKDGYLFVSVMDIGIGFKNTLELNFPENFKRITEKINPRCRKRTIDELCIEAATELGRSGTGVAGRGKGMRCAHKVVHACDEGTFHIHSRRGAYRFYKNRNHPTGKMDVQSYRFDLPATIYTWQLALRS